MTRITVVITGDRDYNNYTEFKDFCDRILTPYERVDIVTGLNTGAESLARQYAEDKNYSIDVIDQSDVLPQEQALDLLLRGDTLISFWDGVNYDTKYMIDRAFWAQLRLKILTYEN